MLIALLAALAIAPPEPIVGRASVIDGDTLEIHGQRIRLWGVDAPEGRQTCSRGGQTYRCGQEAALALANLLTATPIICHQQSMDRYRRIVARCYLARDHDPTVVEDVAGWMVLEGHALDHPRYSRGAYASHEADARDRRAGVWAGEFERPWQWRAER